MVEVAEDFPPGGRHVRIRDLDEVTDDFPPNLGAPERLEEMIEVTDDFPPNLGAHTRFLKSVIEDQEVCKRFLSEFIEGNDGGSRLLKFAIEHELRHRCHRQVNKRLALEIALYHLNGSRADGFSHANFNVWFLRQRFDRAKVCV